MQPAYAVKVGVALEGVHWLRHDIVDRGRLPLLLLLGRLCLTFLVT